MSDKKTLGTKATAAASKKSDANEPAMTDLSLDAVTVPPPPPNSNGALSIPRSGRVPADAKPASPPSKRKRSEDDLFSVFDVESNAAPEEDIPISVQTEPAPAKPKPKLGVRSDEREVSRSRQIPVDQDLFNLRGFSSPDLSPMVPPDMSALVAPGLSENAPAKASSTSSLDDLILAAPPKTQIPPLESLDLLTSKPAAPEPVEKPRSPRSNRAGLFAGIVGALLLAGGVFYYMQSSSPTEATASAEAQTTSTEAALDTRPGQTAPAEEPQTRTAVAGKPQDDTAATKPASTAATTGGSKDAVDRPAVAGNLDKPSGQGKPSEPEATAKPAETQAPASTAKTQSLAEAMAAATTGGAPAPPPPSGGAEFNKAAATAALNSAAGSASGCKAASDPAGLVKVSVTFAPSGRATRAIVSGPPFAGTPTGSCVAAAFRSLSVPPFSGDPVTVSKSVSVH